jgi:hypothetical protein
MLGCGWNFWIGEGVEFLSVKAYFSAGTFMGIGS